MTQRRTPESLTLDDLPGVEPARFDEWKRLNRRARIAFFCGPLIYLTGFITVPAIGGGIGWLLPVVFWFAYTFAFVRPLAASERTMASELGVPAALGLPSAAASTRGKRILKILLVVWLASIVLSVILLAVKLAWPSKAPAAGSSNQARAVVGAAAGTSAEAYTVHALELATDYRGAHVQTGFFAANHAVPYAGRFFYPTDYEPSAPPVVVISQEVWSQLFKGDFAVLGRSMLINGQQTAIVGIVPPGFRLPEGTDFWTPASASK
jgi:hypothetical protein